MKNAIAALAAFLGCAAISGAANAAIIFSDFGPNYSYDWSAGYGIDGSASGVGPDMWAAEFTSPGNFIVTQIDVGVLQNTFFPTRNSVVVELWRADDLPIGSFPHDNFASWQVTGIPSIPVSPPSPPPLVIDVKTKIRMGSGLDYFLAVRPVRANDATSMGWNNNSIGLTGTVSYSSDNSHWTAVDPINSFYVLPAFDIQGTPISRNSFAAGLTSAAVPEPTSLALILGGFFFGATRRFRRRT
jgi:hypothetical protein